MHASDWEVGAAMLGNVGLLMGNQIFHEGVYCGSFQRHIGKDSGNEW